MVRKILDKFKDINEFRQKCFSLHAGKFEVWVTAQGPTYTTLAIAEALGIPERKLIVKVITKSIHLRLNEDLFIIFI